MMNRRRTQKNAMKSDFFSGSPAFLRVLLRFVSVALALLVVACGGDAPPAQAAAPRKGEQRRPVELVAVSARQMDRTVAVQGTLAPDEQVVVSTRVAGHLSSISVDLGSAVTAGQVIAQVEPQDFRLRVEQARAARGQARASLGLADDDAKQAQVDIEQTSTVKQARATLDEAAANLERARQLRERKLVAPAEFDATNTAYLRAEAALESAREDARSRLALLGQRGSELALAQKELTDTQIRAPISGVVSVRTASAGEFLPAASPLVTIVRVDPLRLRVQIPERDAQAVQVGQPVKISLDGDRAAHSGQVARVSPALDETSRTLTVEAVVPNAGQKLRAGTFARAEITVSSEEVLAVPTSALVSFAGLEKLITVEEGKAVEKPVDTGRRAGGFVEIVSGVEAGTRVVLDPGNLQQGHSVEIK
jgi:RND family efflux transporter MFP subunit